MCGCGGCVGKTETSERPEMIIGGVDAIEKKVRRELMYCARGMNVEQDGGGVQRLNPKGRRHAGLQEQGTNYVIRRTDVAFCFTVLRRSMGTSETKIDAVVREVVT